MLLTHAYVHLLADVHSAGFAPAFTLSLCDSEAPANRRLPIASVVMGKFKKTKNRHENKSIIILVTHFFANICS